MEGGGWGVDDGEVISLGANLIAGQLSPTEGRRLVRRGRWMERRQCCSQPQSLCCKTSSAQQKWRQRGGARESVMVCEQPRERKKGARERERERAPTRKNRVWVLAKARGRSAQANAKRHHFVSTLNFLKYIH